MDITFMDTETLGLHPHAPIWEFAAIRRFYSDVNRSYTEERFHCFIKHRPGRWLRQLPAQFQQDYLTRYHREDAVSRDEAVEWIVHPALDGAHVMGAVPNFDTVRIERLMRGSWWDRLRGRTSTPSWNYHLMDIENIVAGYLHAQGSVTALTTPWKSDVLSNAIGVNPELYARHTAMGDVEWVRDQYDQLLKMESKSMEMKR